MIKFRVVPSDRGVAGFALDGEIAGPVVGIGGLFEIRRVATVAVGGGSGKASCLMALVALHRDMGSRQSEVAKGFVIEGSSAPGENGMAGRALVRESGTDVIRIVGLLELFRVACKTFRRGSFKLPVNVAGIAGHLYMSAQKRKTREAGMIKSSPGPPVHSVALFAVSRETSGAVIERFRVLEVLQMAGGALRGESGKNACRCSRVARGAFDRCMRPDQRKAILVIAERLHGAIPALHRVAILATGSKLVAMNVGVAIGAVLSNVAKHHALVTPCAANICVHPS